MSFFDDALITAKAVGETVGKKAEGLLIISKKKLEIIETENRLSKNFEKLGRLYFDSLNFDTSNLTDDVDKDNLVDETTVLSEKLSRLKEELKDIIESKE
ncbi:MAG: hypothetical protein GX345_01480 [Clostridiales bacterium]|nr:hypothetical protein [Clostridiales bacterium]